MENWRDQDYNNYNHDHFTRKTPNSYRKPPIGGSSNWQHSVPSWEKKFCASVGSIPWKKFLETKKCIHLYDNVIKWNDSAGKEAFEKAKSNFYANMYNLPRDNWLPDPDIYIDKINWDSEVDQDLILDLESNAVVPDSCSKDEQVVIFGSNFPPSYQSFSPYGWGDSDDDKKKDKDPNTSPEYNVHQWELQGNEGGVTDHNNNNCWGWNDNNNCWGWNENDEAAKKDQGYGDSRNESPEYNAHQWGLQGNEGGVNDHNNNNCWGWNDNNNCWGWNENDKAAKKDQGYGDSRNDYWGWNMYDNNNYFYANVRNEPKGGSGRYRAPRVRKDDNQGSRSRRNNGNERKSSNSCVPVNASPRARVAAHRWSVKKPVS